MHSVAVSGFAIVMLISTIAIASSVEERSAPRMTFAFMPGDAREISHSDSASNDTALIAYEVGPRVAVTTGGDFAFFLFRFQPLSLRLGLFGMFELSTLGAQRANFLTVPSGHYLWRGLLGYATAVSLDEIGRRLLGLGGAIEIGVSYRHESEHITQADNLDMSRFEGVPHIGDFILLDIGFRKVIGPWVFSTRIQNKFFLPFYDSYTQGPGGDLGIQWWIHEYIHPFISVFGEYLFGRTLKDEQTVSDNRIIRILVGAVFPGEAADILFYFTYAYGNDKGLLASETNHRYGFGIRVNPFKNRQSSTNRSFP